MDGGVLLSEGEPATRVLQQGSEGKEVLSGREEDGIV